MKTIETIIYEIYTKISVNECRDMTKERVLQCMRESVQYAQEWISVEDEIPDLNENNWIILKMRGKGFRKYPVTNITSQRELQFILDRATHWRPLNRI